MWKKDIHICDKCDKKFVYIKALQNHLNEHWDEDVSFFPIKNDIDNSITVTLDKNPSSEKNINIFNNEELFEKIKK